MPRKRNNYPDWLPKYVIARHGWYKLRPYLGRENGKTIFGPEIPVVRTNCSAQEFFRAFEKIQTKSDSRTLSWLLDKYNKSDQFKERAYSTQIEYLRFSENICSTTMKSKSGKTDVLGNLSLKDFTKPKVRQFLDTAKAKVSANRKIQYLSAAWSWAAERYENLPDNPCIGVKLNKEVARDRYPEDWEYWVVYLVAGTMRNPYFAPAMELAYLCRGRRDEVFSLTQNDFRDEGIYLSRSKGSVSEITEWSTRLIAAVDYCKAIYPDAPTPIKGAFLLHDKKGQKYTKNALDSAWQRVVKKAKDRGAELPEALVKEAKKMGAKVEDGRVYLTDGFTFHDIKAKGISDHSMTNSGQHKSKKMEAVYQRKPKVMRATK